MLEYNGVALPKHLLNRIDSIKFRYGYTTKADFIREAIREKIEKLEGLNNE